MIEADRIISSQAKMDEDVIDRAIRPKLLADYVGQPQVREQMDIFIKAAKLRQDALRSSFDLWSSRFRKNNAS